MTPAPEVYFDECLADEEARDTAAEIAREKAVAAKRAELIGECANNRAYSALDEGCMRIGERIAMLVCHELQNQPNLLKRLDARNMSVVAIGVMTIEKVAAEIEAAAELWA